MNCVDRFFDGLMKKSYVCLYKAGMRVQKIGFLFTSLDKIIMTIAQITLADEFERLISLLSTVNKVQPDTGIENFLLREGEEISA